jgi:glycosyltransferase involved in cell wall biosynthesis
MDPMRLLIATESYWPNADGGAFFERRLALGLAARGHHVAIHTPGDRFANYIQQDGDTTIYRERAITFWANRKYKVSFMPFWHVRHILKTEKPDVIHIHNTYWIGLSTLFWAKRYGIPVIATNHFMPENALLNLKASSLAYKPLHRLIWAFLVGFHNRVNFVTSPTPTAVQLLLDHGLKAPAEPVSNGVDTAVFKPNSDTAAVQAKYKLATDRPVVLYVGRLDGEKRLDQILDAWPAVLAQQPAQLVMVGFGKAMAALQAQAERLGISDSVVFTGYLEEAEKPIIYNAANMFVISSPAELQSIVTLEAMATGLPVVSVDVAALKELCHDGENGILFTLEDVPALAAAINRIIADKALHKRFSAESIKIVREHHSTEVMFNHYETIYQHLIQEGRS